MSTTRNLSTRHLVVNQMYVENVSSDLTALVTNATLENRLALASEELFTLPIYTDVTTNNSFFAGALTLTDEGLTAHPLAQGGTLGTFDFTVEGTPVPGATQTFEIYKNGVGTGVTYTLENGAQNRQTWTNIGVEFAAGDIYSIGVTYTSNAPGNIFGWLFFYLS